MQSKKTICTPVNRGYKLQSEGKSCVNGGNELQLEGTSCVNLGNKLQSERISCKIQCNDVLLLLF